MNSFFAPVLCSASVYRLLQNPDEGWHLVKMWVEPILAVKLYVLFVLVSLLVALVQLLRNWFLGPPFRHLPADSAQRVALIFRSQALSLRRWIFLSLLAWAGVTLAGTLNMLGGISASRGNIGLPLMADVFADLLQPTVLFWWVLSLLYVVRWHILWRAERLERRQQRVPEEQFSARISK